MVVAIVTQWFDPTADYVIAALNDRQVPVFRFDIADFPMRLRLSAALTSDSWTGDCTLAERKLSLSQITGIYFRRPSDFDLPAAMGPAELQWAAAEARMGLGGVLSAIPCWLNHPSRVAAAEFKPVQLSTAARVGLRVPRTIITSDAQCAREFADSVGTVVYKPLAGSSFEQDGHRRLLYAQPIAREDLVVSSISLTAQLFQEWIEHEYAVRLTVVDHRFFACAIYAHSEAARKDWRSDYPSLQYVATDVPQDVQERVVLLMNELGLRFGALDFLVTPEGKWIFLEINPNGQWAWIEEETSLPIAAAIADALTGTAA